ncbi:MAG: PepSY-associated TM helix domain-containing protein [Ginsengibacter sp.]
MKKGKRIFSWHHWCGLIVGIFLLLMSISGSLLVFSDEIEVAYESNWIAVNNPSGSFFYDASFSHIQKLYPGWEIRLYEQPGINEALVYDLRKGTAMKKIFVHPVDGSILHVSDKVQDQLHRILLSLHYTLFAGTAGKIIVFFIGILFLVSLITGIYIYRKAIIRVIFFSCTHQ